MAACPNLPGLRPRFATMHPYCGRGLISREGTMNAPRFWNPLLGKALAIGGLTLVLLMPLAQLRDLIGERSTMRHIATTKVAEGWGGMQSVGAPILTLPFEIEVESRGRTIRRVAPYRILAAMAQIRGELETSERHVGIYTVPVYQTRLHLTAAFAPASLTLPTNEGATPNARWSEATLFVPISDLRGVREIVAARWGEQTLNLQPAAYDGLAGVSAPVDLTALRNGQTRELVLEIELAGTRSLRALPLAAVTTVELRSAWPHPSFDGAFLPASYTVTADGFDARWQVLELNRGFAQSWTDQAVGSAQLTAAAFGVSLFQPVDVYQRSERALKYAVLFIALTFMSVFLWEHLAGQRIHAMQYLLVGLALCVFYLLLIALSEHILFAWSYLVAAAAQALLIGIYLGSALKHRCVGVVVSSALGAVYGLLYLLILSEDYSLLLGATFVFVALAAIMWVTRRTDWYQLGERARRAIAEES
jgi:inner membrane protein